MFTGIIEEAGIVRRVVPGDRSVRLEIEAPGVTADLKPGDSVAVNGVCLTAVVITPPQVAFDAIHETLARTSLGSLRPEHRVNLERPMRAGGRFDGHIVQGHVDGTAVLREITPEGNSHRLHFELAEELRRYVVEKGSICVDGISLTVAALTPQGFEVAIIPHTWEVTNLSGLRPGLRVNIEVDVLAKYVERLLRPIAPVGAP